MKREEGLACSKEKSEIVGSRERANRNEDYIRKPSAPHNTTSYLMDLREGIWNYSDDGFGSMLQLI